MWLLIISSLKNKNISSKEILDNLYISNPPLAYHYLKAYYKENDQDFLEENRIKKELEETGYGNKSKNKKKFFENFIEKHGFLFCQICGNKHLSPVFNKKENPATLATIEHFIPISEGGLKYNSSNWLCTCSRCNNKRGTLPLYRISEYMYIY